MTNLLPCCKNASLLVELSKRKMLFYVNSKIKFGEEYSSVYTHYTCIDLIMQQSIVVCIHTILALTLSCCLQYDYNDLCNITNHLWCYCYVKFWPLKSTVSTSCSTFGLGLIIFWMCMHNKLRPNEIVNDVSLVTNEMVNDVSLVTNDIVNDWKSLVTLWTMQVK